MAGNPTEADAEKLAAAKLCASDPQWLFQELNKRMKISPAADAQLRVTAHIRERTGHATIAAFHNNGATREEKVEIYQECLKAVIKNDFTTLNGTVPSGQAQVKAPPREEIPAQEPDRATPKLDTGRRNPLDALNEAEPPKVETPAARKPAVEGKQAQLMAMLAQLLEGQSATVDPDEVARIAKGICESEIKVRMADLRGIVSGHRDEAVRMVNEYLAKIPPRDVVQITAIDGTVKEINRQHYKFPLLVAALSQRLNVLLVGPAGSSKTTAAHAASEALKLEFEAISVGPMTSKADLFGFVDANGKYHDTATVRRAEQGGVMLWDEVDAANAGVLTAGNMLLANGHLSTPVGMKTKHKDFVLIAAANTYGMGANRVYVGRNQLDGATLDRFVVIDWGYDHGLEAHIVGLNQDSLPLDVKAGGHVSPSDWFAQVIRVREACAKLAIRHVVSPRATIHGVKLFAAGIGRKHVEDMVLWKGMDEATQAKIVAATA